MEYYKKAQEFHDTFDKVDDKSPHSLSKDQVLIRSHFMIEELVEYLHTVAKDEESFAKGCEQLKESIEIAKNKIINKEVSDIEEIVSQSDALVDLLYYIYGTFVMMQVNPDEIYNLVHQANMNKLFPDGKPHYDEITGKVLKPKGWQGPEKEILQEINKQRKDFKCDK